jgi:hypothetical protein
MQQVCGLLWCYNLRAGLIAISPGYFVFKSENVKVKVKYGFVLHTGFSRISLSTCK